MNVVLSAITYSYIGGDNLRSALEISIFIYIAVIFIQFFYLYLNLPVILIKSASNRNNLNNVFLRYIISFKLNIFSRLIFYFLYIFNIIFTVFVVLFSTNYLDIDVRVSIWSWTAIYGTISLKIWWTRLKIFFNNDFNKSGYNIVYTNIDRWVKLTLNLANSDISEKILKDYKTELKHIDCIIDKLEKKDLSIGFEIKKYLRLLEMLKNKRDIMLVSGVLLFYIFELLEKENLTFYIFNYDLNLNKNESEIEKLGIFYYFRVISNEEIVYDFSADTIDYEYLKVIKNAFIYTVFQNNSSINPKREILRLGYTISPYLIHFQFILVLWELISLIDIEIFQWNDSNHSRTVNNEESPYVEFNERKWYFHSKRSNKAEKEIYDVKFSSMKLEIRYDIFLKIILEGLNCYRC